MDVGCIIGILGILFGALIGIPSLIYAIMQHKTNKNIEKRGYRFSWDLAKSANYLLERIEKLKPYLDKNDKNFNIHYGRIHQQCINLIQSCLQNVFLSNKPIPENEERQMRDSGFLSGELDEIYSRMKLNPPESWNHKNEERC